ncbi:guanosine monophosphate reductase [Patescibacteria group bacterium]|nr:guanosine monophosphate reductase [Patescibacteria group bacterium]
MNKNDIDKIVRDYLRKKGLPENIAVTFPDVTIKDNFSNISSRSDILDLKARLSEKIKIDIPIVSANMDTVTGSRMAIAIAKSGGLGFIHQFAPIKERVEEVKKVKKAKLKVGAAVGLSKNYMLETESLLKAGIDVLLLDTARANCEKVQKATKEIKKVFKKVQLIVGNVDTSEATLMLIEAGADGVKVGIGPGSACKTREVAGVGIPQITAIALCSAIAQKFGTPIIADGGIKFISDIGKAIVAGADTVMIGSLFAGADESPGQLHRDTNELWKIYRGSASLEHQLDRLGNGNLGKTRTPEGVLRKIPYTGPVKSIVESMIEGLCSSMSYVGTKRLVNFLQKGKFVYQTRAGYEEGMPKI